jgi:Type II CAAX prenyl endopeptidase Rce1-like
MAEKLEVLSGAGSMDSRLLSAGVEAHYRRDLREIAAVFVSILIAVWTPQGKAHAFFSIVVAACVVAFAIVGRWGARDLGLTRPFSGLGYILAAGAVLCGVTALIGIPLRLAGAGNTLPLSRSWQYGFWALQQEFILQSIFFVRLETMLDPRRAVIAAASLFAVAHIPSPALTVLSFCGGILFCELFRRWRNLYPLGIIHGALGLTIAASLPDKWLHHMRVGIGYLTLHS